jgi:hypothetical protein
MKINNNDTINHNYYTISDVRRMAQDYSLSQERDRYPIDQRKRQIYVAVPNRDENQDVLKRTIENIGFVNFYANKAYGADFKLNGIILSDQSNEENVKRNKGKLHTARDWLERIYGDSGIAIPNMYHLVLGKHTDEIVGDYASKYFGDVIASNEEPRGKGWNMLMSSLATGRYPDDEVAIIYMDAENEQIGPDQIFAMGWPMYEMESRLKFIKAAFDRYHMEGDLRRLGGRVNASIFKPMIDMYFDNGILPRILYPLSGEIAVRRDALWSINVARMYGVEWAMVLQYLSRYSPHFLDMENEFAEIFLGLNMDQPLGEGKDVPGILEDIGKMANEILPVNNFLLGDTIQKRWGNSREFIKQFKEYQERNRKRLSRHRRNEGEIVKITGGITASNLFNYSRKRVQENMKKLYEEGVTSTDLLYPLSEVRDGIGVTEFDGLLGSMTEARMIIE